MLIRLFRIRISTRIYMKDISLAFVPVIAAFFVGLSFMEIVTKFPYWGYILNDIKGVETTKSILFRQIDLPRLAYWTEIGFIIILIASLAAGVFISFRVIRKQVSRSEIPGDSKIIYALPVIFIIILVTETFIFICL